MKSSRQRELVRERNRRWRAKNSDYRKKWRLANPEKESEYQRRYYEKNRAKKKASNKRWWKEHPGAKTISQRKRNGCIDPSGEVKVGNCEICNKRCKLRYDHNHKTGLFRGWLCNNCNMKLDWYIENQKGVRLYVKKVQEDSNS